MAPLGGIRHDSIFIGGGVGGHRRGRPGRPAPHHPTVRGGRRGIRPVIIAGGIGHDSGGGGDPASASLPLDQRPARHRSRHQLTNRPQLQPGWLSPSGTNYVTSGLLGSHAAVTGPGEITLTTPGPDTLCTAGDTGVYAYVLSPGSTRLTMAMKSEDCAARAIAVPGEWFRVGVQDHRRWLLGRPRGRHLSIAVRRTTT